MDTIIIFLVGVVVGILGTIAVLFFVGTQD